jgi:hypothetical protein
MKGRPQPGSSGRAVALAVAALAAAVPPGCALPVVSANTFQPAGDTRRGELRATLALEMGRVLVSPADVELDPAKVPADAARWEVSTWIAGGVGAVWAPTDQIALQAQLLLTNPIDPFVPEPVGGAVAARLRLLDRPGGPDGPRGWAIELGPRLVGLGVSQDLVQTAGSLQQIDRWTYQAYGLELPVIVTDRISPQLALTAAPFLRSYVVRAWHDLVTGAGHTTTSRLQWTPTLSAGISVSAALQLGSISLVPGVTLELASRPGVGAPKQLLFEPGLSMAVGL